jgi:hypothetical protein
MAKLVANSWLNNVFDFQDDISKLGTVFKDGRGNEAIIT